MDAQATAVFLRYFTGLKDPRRHNTVHRFTDILTIAILAVLCRSNDWVEVVEWARVQKEWLKTFLELPRGIPSVDTFRRVFARIDPAAFERCFTAWTGALAEALPGRVVAVDGKALRRSFTQAWEKQGMVHMVSAWCNHNQLVLGQVACDSKSNEITAIPALLDLLNLKGAVVTIDAIGCQKNIAADIVNKGADYVLAVKENQPMLHQKVSALINDLALSQTKGQAVACGYSEQTDGGHGRIETRRVWTSDQVQWLGEDLLKQWAGLSSITMVQIQRQQLNDPTGKVTIEHRYYISSLSGCDAQRFGQAVRQHWGVENQLHWRLDMSCREDESRVRTGNGAQNFSRVRRIVLNKLKSDPRKASLKVKRYRCSIDREYLIGVISR